MQTIPLSIQLPETPLTITREQFVAIVAENPDLRLEHTANGELIVNPPTGWETGARNTQITGYLFMWANSFGGLAFDSSTGCQLLNGSLYSPDASWASEETLAEARQLPPVTGEYFPLCPDFVVELRSKSDRLSPLQEKMQEYIENGARLGWLIDPKKQRVEIYRPGQKVEILEQPESLSGDDLLPGFVLPLARIWR